MHYNNSPGSQLVSRDYSFVINAATTLPKFSSRLPSPLVVFCVLLGRVKQYCRKAIVDGVKKDLDGWDLGRFTISIQRELIKFWVLREMFKEPEEDNVK